MSRPLTIGLLMISVVAVTGCEPSDPRSRSRQGGVIAVIGTSQTDPLWPILEATTARFQRTTAEYELRCVAPERPSHQLQAALLDDLQEQGLRAVCIQVADPLASRPMLERLRDAGVVVVALMKSVDAGEPFLFSGIDEMELGVRLAEALAGQIEGHGTYAVLHAGGDPSYRQRLIGFRRKMKRYPRLTMLKEVDCSERLLHLKDILGETTERFPGLDGWASLGDWPVAKLVAEDGVAVRWRLVRPGPLPGIHEQIQAGHCDTVVVADYEKIMSRAIEMCAATLEGKTLILPRFNAPLRLITAANSAAYQQEWNGWLIKKAAPAQQDGH